MTSNCNHGLHGMKHRTLRSTTTPGGWLASGATLVFVLAVLLPLPATAARPLPSLPTPCPGGACGTSPSPTPFVSAGSGSYSVNGNNAVVRQIGNKAIFNWKDYNVGAGNSVRYVRTDINQNPIDGASFTSLNRIWQGSPSVIAGAIDVQPGQNGSIYLINQNGILFKGGTQLDTSVLVNAGLNIANFSSKNGHLYSNGVAVDDATLQKLGLYGASVSLQDGKLFKGGARVNANTLIVSALDIKDEDFLSNNGIYNPGLRATGSMAAILPVFVWNGTNAEDFKNTFVRVEPGAELEAQLGGSILLLAPNVANAGRIITTEGQVALAAGAKAYITLPDAQLNTTEDASPYHNLTGFLIEVDPFRGAASAADSTVVRQDGMVTNAKSIVASVDASGNPAIDSNGNSKYEQVLGEIIATRGNATLVALAINQYGRISATTSVRSKGSIRLLARDNNADQTFEQPSDDAGKELGHVVNVASATDTGTLTFGQGSVTEVLPDLSDPLTLTDNQPFAPSTIQGVAHTIVLEQDARVVASGGYITLSAQAQGNRFLPQFAANNTRIYQATGSVIDTSGAAGATAAVERYFRDIDLRAAELGDDPLNRDNPVLRGKILQVDLRNLPDNSLANLSAYKDLIARSVTEKLAAGGTVALRSEGDIVLRSGSKIDVSGSSVAVTGGYGSTSKLVSQGQVYDLTQAKGDRVYQVLINDRYAVTDPKWGVTRSYGLLGNRRYYQSYVEGKDAGKVILQAKAYALEGDIVGHVTAGTNQRVAPQLGQLLIGDDVPSIANGAPQKDYQTPDLTIVRNFNPLSTTFGADSALPDPGNTLLSADMLNRSGLGKVTVYSNGKITLSENSGLQLPAFGKLSLNGQVIEVRDNVSITAGSISLKTLDTGNSPRGDVTLAPGVKLSTVGEWQNDGFGFGTSFPIVTASGKRRWDGGSITLDGQNVTLGSGSVLDISASAYVQSSGKLSTGNAGDITIAAVNKLSLPTALRSVLLARSPGNGGSLTLKAQSFTIGSVARGVQNEFLIDPAFFNANDFAKYNLQATESVVVEPGVLINPTVTQQFVDASFRSRPIGSDIQNFSRRAVPLPYQRQAVDFSLQALDTINSRLTLKQGARIVLDARGKVLLASTGNVLLEQQSEITAPAGNIALKIIPAATPNYSNSQAIWISSGAKLSVAGTFIKTPSNDGLRHGNVLDGGAILLDAQYGYVVTEAGAVLDVSAASATVDTLLNSSPYLLSQRIAGNAGSIQVNAREGGLLDATLLGASAGGLDGSLSLTLDNTDSSPDTTFPNLRQNIDLSQNSGNNVPVGLNPNSNIAQAAPGTLKFDLAHATQGGFEQLSFTSKNAVRFKGNIDLPASQGLRALTFSAPALESDGGKVNLAAYYVNLGNQSQAVLRQVTQTPVSGTGELSVTAKLIDLTGHLALNGINRLSLNEGAQVPGEVRLVGIDKNKISNSAPVTRPEGSLDLEGNLLINARQIYATSFTDYAINVNGSGADAGTASFQRAGADSPVLSAGSRVVINARNIDFDGVLKAPLGQIILGNDTTENLVLGRDSLVSVSGENQLIPFGITTTSGGSYGYQLDAGILDLSASRPFAKGVRLNGKNVAFQQNATLDVSGGGDLQAYEFIPGIGGSKDVLSPTVSPNTYAILPDYQGSAPYDRQTIIELGKAGLSAPVVGSSVYLASDAGGLPGGRYYTLLPARYALLPGAYLVTAAGSAYQDIPSQQAIALTTGAAIVSGNLAVLNGNGTYTQTSRTGGFLVEPGKLALTRSQYLLTKATQFYASSGQAPGDAGSVVFNPSQTLQLAGRLLAQREAGYRGAEVDIVAKKLALVAPNFTAASDAVKLNVDVLTQLGAESLYIGGTRQRTAQGVDLTVVAQEVVLTNDAEHPLSAPEIVLAATDKVQVTSGSVLKGVGDNSDKTEQIIHITNPTQDGAVLRVSSGKQATITRTSNTLNASLILDAKSQLYASGAFNADAANTILNGTFSVGAGGSLALAASQVNLGDATNASGLTFSKEDLNALLSQVGDLRLTSRGAINLYGELKLPDSTTDLQLRGTGLQAFNGKNGAAADVVLSGNLVSLENPDASQVLTAQGGNASLKIRSTELHAAGAGRFALSGFGDVILKADTQIVAGGKGSLETKANLTLDTPRITAQGGTQYAFNTSKSLNITSSLANSNLDADRAAATLARALPLGYAPDASIGFQGASTDVDSWLILFGGKIDIAATSGNLILRSGAVVSTAGRQAYLFDAPSKENGGTVRLSAVHNLVDIQSGAKVDVSATGADAGILQIQSGSLILQGDILGSSAADTAGTVGSQGRFDLMIDALGELGGVADKLKVGGFTDTVNVSVANGPLSLAQGKTLQARVINLSVDGGSISIAGTLDAQHARGGSITLAAAQDVTLTDSARLYAQASDQDRQGGQVTLSAKNGYLDLRKNSEIHVDGGSGGLGGQVWLRTGVNNDKIRVRELASTITGTDYQDAAGVTYSATYLEAVNQVDQNNALVLYKNRSADVLEILAKPDTSASNTNRQILIGDLQNATNTFYNGLKIVDAVGTSKFRVVPGLQLVNTEGAITLSSDWNFGTTIANKTLPNGNPNTSAIITSIGAPALRFGTGNIKTEAGVLSLLAKGDIKINASLSDSFRDIGGSFAVKDWLYETTLVPTAIDASGKKASLVDSWSYRIVAGSDFQAASADAVNRGGTGSIIIGQSGNAGQVVRTGAGFITVAASGDLTFNQSGSGDNTRVSTLYTAGRATPTPNGFNSPPKSQAVGQVRTYNPVSYQLAVFTNAGGNIKLDALGAINGAEYDAVESVQAGIKGEPIINQWLFRYYQSSQANPQTSWWSRFDHFRQGVATLGGGDIQVVAGKDINNLWLSAPTNARLAGDPNQAPTVDNLLVQGGGDIMVHAGGAIQNGLVFLGRGKGKIVSEGSLQTRVALQDAVVQLTARNDVTLTDAFNPTALAQHVDNSSTTTSSGRASFFNSYGDRQNDASLFNAGVQVLSLAGNVDLSSTSRGATIPNLTEIYPGTLQVFTPNGDIKVNGVLPNIALFPNALGNLDLLAGQNILFNQRLILSDYDLGRIAGIVDPRNSSLPDLGVILQPQIVANPELHNLNNLHGNNDPNPVRIYAGLDVRDVTGSTNNHLNLAKPAIIRAGQNYLDLGVEFQNLSATDVSAIYAGRNLTFNLPKPNPDGTFDADNRHLEVSGPGRFEVNVGGNINLASSDGILTIGDGRNPYLGADGASLLIAAGLGAQPTGAARQPDYMAFADKYFGKVIVVGKNKLDAEGDYIKYLDALAHREVKAKLEYNAELSGAPIKVTDAELDGVYKTQVDLYRQGLVDAYFKADLSTRVRAVFFNELREASKDFNAKGDASRGKNAAAFLFPKIDNGQPVNYAGDINLFFSQIKTIAGGGIDIFAPGGLLNVGLASTNASSKSPDNQGIYTARNGDVNIYVRDDVLVNQSRIFTLGGSDLQVWSELGNIDAGKGAKTAAATPPPRLVLRNGRLIQDFSGAVSGSGIGTLDTNSENKKGNVVLTAANGVIDASDAGIVSGGDLAIAAIQVLGSDNIKAGGTSVGVPIQQVGVTGSTISTNPGDVSNVAGEITKSITDGNNQQDLDIKKAIEGFRPSFISVEVVGFGKDGGQSSGLSQ